MIEYKYNDEDDRCIEVYRDDVLIDHIFYELNDYNDMIELTELLNKLTAACDREIL